MKKALYILLAHLVVLSACSDERVNPEARTYEDLSNYYESEKEPEQTYTITDDAQCPLVGIRGTKICGAISRLALPSGGDVTHPYEIRIVELYTPKHLIFYQHPTSNTTDHELRLKAYKDDQELSLKSGQAFETEFKNSVPETGMEVYVGLGDDIATWNSTSRGSFTNTSYGYLGYPNQTGWISVAKPNNVGSTVTLSFTSLTDSLRNVSCNAYIPSTKTLIIGENGVISGIPSGIDTKIALFGRTSDDEFFHYYTKEIFTESITKDIELSEISESDLHSLLDNL